MDINLTGKNALVCGSSKGIGKAAAFALAELGANVTLVARSAGVMAGLISQMDDTKGQSHDFLQADFSDVDNVRRQMTGLVSGKNIHILVNNTGGPPPGPIAEANPEDFLQAFNQHIICSQIITQKVIKGMIDDHYGRIINVISTSVKAPLDGLGVSNTIRGSMANWAKTWANELAPHGITVNNILPGATETGRLAAIIERKAKKLGQSTEKVEADWKKMIPMKRFANPTEIANAIAFLASPASSYITGINVPVDGGRTKSL